jgi:hypothetical protein
MGLTAYFVLSPVTGLVCHRHQRDAKHHRQLDASVGASGPHDFAVRAQCHSSFDMPRPSHPAPDVRDDRDTPLLWERDGATMKVIWAKRTPEYFYAKGWTAGSVICPSGPITPSPIARFGHLLIDLARRGDVRYSRPQPSSGKGAIRYP